MEKFCKDVGVELPARTIMVFENVITTPKQDRDGDILRTGGASVDENMPLLWHHMLPMPMGKMLKVLKHTDKLLKVATAVIDSTIGRDAAALVEFGALRISHGFRPIKFEMLERTGEGFPGFDIKTFEIMEQSLVSVPSNTDAVITAFSRGKFASPLFKGWGKSLFDSRPKKVASGVTIKDGKVTVEDDKSNVTVQQGSDGAVTIWSETDSNSEEEEKVAPVASDKGACTCGAKDIDPLKQGRVLSKANEDRLAKASELLDEVLTQVRESDTDSEELKLSSLAAKVAKALVASDGKDVGDAKLIHRMLDTFIAQKEAKPKRASKLVVRGGRVLVTQ